MAFGVSDNRKELKLRALEQSELELIGDTHSVNVTKRKVLIATVALLFAVTVFISWRIAPLTRPIVPLGTKELAVGKKLFDPAHPERFQWTVIDVDRNYEFPDGDNRPGVKVRGESGSVWKPRETLEMLMVMQ
jgi:hypothetical protein